VMNGRWKKMEVETQSSTGGATSILGVGDSGKFHLSCSGAIVESVEGLKQGGS